MRPSEKCFLLCRHYDRVSSDGEIRQQMASSAKHGAGLITRSLEQWQIDAVTSLLVDVARASIRSKDSSLEDSKLVHFVNDGMMQLAGAEFMKWVYLGSRIDTSSLSRRKDEQDLFRGMDVTLRLKS